MGVTVVIGGVMLRWFLMRYNRTRIIVVGYAERSWPQLLRDFAVGECNRVDEGPGYRFANVPERRRDLLKKDGDITINTVQRCEAVPDNRGFPSGPLLVRESHDQV